MLELPNNDINETLQLHDENIFIELLNNRKEIFLSTEKEGFEKVKVTEEKSVKSVSNTTDFLQQKTY